MYDDGLKLVPAAVVAVGAALALGAAISTAAGPATPGAPSPAWPAADPAADYTYDLRVDADLGAAQVRMCAREPLSGALVPEETYCLPFVDEATFDLAQGGAVTVERDGSAISIPPGAGQCARWTLDLGASSSRLDWDGRIARRSGASIVASPDLLLWHVQALPEDAVITARFHLAEGQSVSAPWPPLPGGAWRVPPATFQRQTGIALGRLRHVRVEVGGGALEVAILDGPGDLAVETARAWLAEAARGITLVSGAFPRERVQVILEPVRSPRRPVPFGKSVRGGGWALHLFVNPGASLEALTADWVAVHEMSHLMHPFVDFDDAWISEGLATYYQEIVLARAGHKTESQALQALLDGLERGRRGAEGSPLTLREASRTLSQSHDYGRVYWTGAAFALLADLALREGGTSLDVALTGARSAHPRDARALSSDELAAALDAAVGGDRMRRLHDAVADRPGFPDLAGAMRALGIAAVDPMILSDDAAARALRRALFAPPPAAPSTQPPSP